MTLKTNENDPNNRGRQESENALRSIWLGRQDLNSSRSARATKNLCTLLFDDRLLL